MKKKTIALIYREDKSSWKSCQSITSNLIKSYRATFVNDKIISLEVSPDLNSYSAYILAKKIKENNIDILVWADHKPNAALLLNALEIVYQEINFEKRPKFIIHLFGDFVLDCLAWKNAEKALKNWPLHFITASFKQKHLVESFFTERSQNISVVPFPVDESEYYFDSSDKFRNEFRKKLGIGAEDLVVLYTGRVSYQKNIEIMVKVFSTIKFLIPQKIHLLIAGEWDDILVPYAGKIGPLGSFYAQFAGTSDKYLNNQVRFLGKLESSQMLKAYNSADLFMSLSTYNDEDYGMSPAEAMCCGLPCLLSNWGGYSSFKNYNEHIELVPIAFGNGRPQVSIELARKKLIKLIVEFLEKKYSRTDISKTSQNCLSCSSISKTLLSAIDTFRFSGIEDFSDDFLKLCVLSEMNPGSPFKKGKKNELSEFYKVVYEGYGS